jgi:preprotein translocase SecE subunit
MKLLQYLKETKAELKEVVFPTSSQTIIYTVLVIVISLLVAVMLWAADFGLKELLTKIVTLRS